MDSTPELGSEAASDPVDEPFSRVYLSVDLVGSTAYKQVNRSTWQQMFLNFYYQFPQQLAIACQESANPLDFSLWKAVGDELIFWAPVTKPEDVGDAVITWLHAIDLFEDSVLDGHTLACKGGAFAATFQAPDSECAIPREPSDHSDRSVGLQNHDALEARDPTSHIFDCFGPSFDTGFRVIAASTTNKFTLSVEVAAALLSCLDECRRNQPSFERFKTLEVSLSGSQPLKGVWGDRDYPLFVIERRASKAERAIRGLNGTPDVERMLDAAIECLNDDRWPSAIYLPKSKDQRFANPPSSPDWLISDNEMIGVETLPEPSDAAAQHLEDSPPLD